MSGSNVPTNIVQSPGVGVISADQLNTYVQTDVTANQLRNFTGTQNMVVVLQGISSANDGGYGPFYWNVGTGYTDDNLNTIIPYGVTTGAWLRLQTNLGQYLSAAAPATPPAGTFYIYMDSADNKLKAKGPSGTVTILAVP